MSQDFIEALASLNKETPNENAIDENSQLPGLAITGLDVLELILRQLQANELSYLAKAGTAGSDVLKRQVFDLFIKELEAEFPFAADGPAIIEIVVKVLTHFPQFNDQPVILRGLAEALDKHFAKAWTSLFRRRCSPDDTLIVSRLSAFPIIRSEALSAAREKFGSWQVSGNPQTLNDSPSMLENVGLLTHDTHDVRYDFSMWGKDDAVWESGDLPEYATGLLNHREEIGWDYCTENSQRCFIRVQPRGAKACLSRADATPTNRDDWQEVQIARAKSLIAQAARERVHVLVLPELCVTTEMQEELAQFSNAYSHPTVLVLGSAHDCRDSGGCTEQQNVLRMQVKGRDLATIYHRKFEPLRVKERKGSQSDVTIELLSKTTRTITILATKRLSLLGLICKDFLMHTTRQVVGQLSLGHILVPAYSDKTAPFQVAGGSLAMANQTIVVIADNGISNVELGRIKKRTSPSKQAKKFATFAMFAQHSACPAAAVCHEPEWSGGFPALPVLMRLQWASNSDEVPLVVAEPNH